MNKQTIRKRTAGGQFLNEGKVPRNITVQRDIAKAVKEWGEKRGITRFSNAAEVLLYHGLKAKGWDVSHIEEPVYPLPPEAQKPPIQDGITHVDHSPINANATENASATIQIGKANRSVSVKKNHDKPVRRWKGKRK